MKRVAKISYRDIKIMRLVERKTLKHIGHRAEISPQRVQQITGNIPNYGKSLFVCPACKKTELTKTKGRTKTCSEKCKAEYNKFGVNTKDIKKYVRLQWLERIENMTPSQKLTRREESKARYYIRKGVKPSEAILEGLREHLTGSYLLEKVNKL